MRTLTAARFASSQSQEKCITGAEKAQEARMKTYLLMALAGLLACAIAGMIFLEMTQQISPD